jgi:hypothetical protein
MKKFTQEQADELDRSVGAIPIGVYFGNSTGWKLLNIKSDGTDLPSEKQLRKVLLNCFQHNIKKRTITMKSWLQAKQKFNGIA